jgi:hypothetical protein
MDIDGQNNQGGDSVSYIPPQDDSYSQGIDLGGEWYGDNY